MRLSIVTLMATAYAGVATACSQLPVGSNPSGNPISAPALQVLEAGKPFPITWSVRVQVLQFLHITLHSNRTTAYHSRNRLHCASLGPCDQRDTDWVPGRQHPQYRQLLLDPRDVSAAQCDGLWLANHRNRYRAIPILEPIRHLQLGLHRSTTVGLSISFGEIYRPHLERKFPFRDFIGRHQTHHANQRWSSPSSDL
jgi:hypothetical protein